MSSLNLGLYKPRSSTLTVGLYKLGFGSERPYGTTKESLTFLVTSTYLSVQYTVKHCSTSTTHSTHGREMNLSGAEKDLRSVTSVPIPVFFKNSTPKGTKYVLVLVPHLYIGPG